MIFFSFFFFLVSLYFTFFSLLLPVLLLLSDPRFLLIVFQVSIHQPFLCATDLSPSLFFSRARARAHDILVPMCILGFAKQIECSVWGNSKDFLLMTCEAQIFSIGFFSNSQLTLSTHVANLKMTQSHVCNKKQQIYSIFIPSVITNKSVTF